MPPGKRQSPFIGKLVDRAGILYPRATSLDDILLEPAGGQDPAEAGGTKAGKERKGKRKAAADAAVTEPAAEPAEAPEGKRRRKQRKSEAAAADSTAADVPAAEAPAAADKKQRKAAADAGELANGHAQEEAAAPVTAAQQLESPAAAGEGSEGQEAAANKPKRERKKKQKAAKRLAAPSGPGNEQQAQQMRSILGLPVAGKQAQPSAQPAGFSFGFAPEQQAADADAEDAGEAAAEPAAAKPAPSQAAPSSAAAAEEEDPELRARLRRVMGEGPELVPRRVFVGGMPFHYEEEQVREYWAFCGEIESLDLLRFPDTGRFRGIAFVTFADEAGYAEALKCDGEYIDEQQLKVKPCAADTARRGGRAGREPAAAAARSEARRRASEPAPKTPGYHVAYVGNVAFEASALQLKALFAGCDVSFVRLHTDKETGKSKGFAHVHFADEASLDRALEFDGTPLMGREIKVGYAQPKKG